MRMMLAAAALTMMPVAQAAAPTQARVPVLVELFTSEGCSSCPPADALLSALRAEQPVPGVDIIPLGLHVDYWDQLGWKDPGSLHEATTRQDAYAQAFRSAQIYTPQAIVDGAAQVVGSDAAALRTAIRRAAERPHVEMSVRASFAGDAVDAVVNAGAVPAGIKEPVQAVVALVEDDVTSAVSRGENRGRTLHHDAVVRALEAVRTEAGAARASFTLQPSWNRAHLRVVACLQGKRSEHVFGSAATGPLAEAR